MFIKDLLASSFSFLPCHCFTLYFDIVRKSSLCKTFSSIEKTKRQNSKKKKEQESDSHTEQHCIPLNFGLQTNLKWTNLVIFRTFAFANKKESGSQFNNHENEMRTFLRWWRWTGGGGGFPRFGALNTGIYFIWCDSLCVSLFFLLSFIKKRNLTNKHRSRQPLCERIKLIACKSSSAHSLYLSHTSSHNTNAGQKSDEQRVYRLSFHIRLLLLFSVSRFRVCFFFAPSWLSVAFYFRIAFSLSLQYNSFEMLFFPSTLSSSPSSSFSHVKCIARFDPQ